MLQYIGLHSLACAHTLGIFSQLTKCRIFPSYLFLQSEILLLSEASLSLIPKAPLSLSLYSPSNPS